MGKAYLDHANGRWSKAELEASLELARNLKDSPDVRVPETSAYL